MSGFMVVGKGEIRRVNNALLEITRITPEYKEVEAVELMDRADDYDFQAFRSEEGDIYVRVGTVDEVNEMIEQVDEDSRPDWRL